MRVFLSYTRNKDDFGAVSGFRERLTSELKNYDKNVLVYQDKSEIEAGANYPADLQTALEGTDVLLAHISPSWLGSKWCRWEFDVFSENGMNSAKLLKVIPLLVVPTVEVNSESNDHIAKLLSSIQSIDVSDLRNVSQSSTAYKKFVAKLSKRINSLAIGQK